MTIFVAGVHGVGKSYLCQQYAKCVGARHESASSLIKQERQQQAWSVDKKAADIGDNQVALAAAVQRIREAGEELLLDGHFVLIDQRAELVFLDDSVFAPLHLSGVIVIEAPASVVEARLIARDSVANSVDLDGFLQAERAQALHVTQALGIPIVVLTQPDLEQFSMAIESFR